MSGFARDRLGHLQATGRDVRQRKQYRYHPDWRLLRDSAKFQRMIEFGDALPRLRRRVRRDLAREGLPREKVLAAIVSLLDATWIRVGNAEYARDNDSYGLTTLRNRHVRFLRSGRLLFQFRAKGGAAARGRRRRQAARRASCGGVTSFRGSACSSISTKASRQPVDSGQVNQYLKDVTGAAFTAKDFRTWGATLRAIEIMARTPLPESMSEHALNGCIVAAVKEVAAQLRNTPAVCRKSYINPVVFAGWRNGVLHEVVHAEATKTASERERQALVFLRRMAQCARPSGRRMKSPPPACPRANLRNGRPRQDARGSPSASAALGARGSAEAIECPTHVRPGIRCPRPASHGSPTGSSTLSAVDAHAPAPRDRKGEPARAPGRHARHVAPSGAARLGAHPSERHDRLQRGAARAHYRRARQRRRAASRELTEIHQVVYRAIGDELLWCASMPCRLPADEDIPIGRYGTSNVGRAKSIYRMGLSHRYGRRMQTISGIHYNFSLPGELSSAAYFALIRNFRRYSWLLLYLFGASPAVCASFVAGRAHELERLSEDTFYLPHATSLRMGRLGYQSDAQSSLAVSYNNLESYAASLQEALTKPYPAYEAVGIRDGDDYRQLATSLLQIENEFYGTIRPKRVIRPASGRCTRCATAASSTSRCASWTSIPFHAVGITADTMRFLDTFLLHCLLLESPPDTPEELAAIVRNKQRVAARGRAPGLSLLRAPGEVTLQEWGSRNSRRVRAHRGCAGRGERRTRASRRSRERRRGARRSCRHAVGARARGDGARSRQLARPVRSRAVARASQGHSRAAVVRRSRRALLRAWPTSRLRSRSASKPPTRCRSNPIGSSTSRRFG